MPEIVRGGAAVRIGNGFLPDNFVEVSPHRCGVLEETPDHLIRVDEEYRTYLGRDGFASGLDRVGGRRTV